MTDLMLKRQQIINEEFLGQLYRLIATSGEPDKFVYKLNGYGSVIEAIKSAAYNRVESIEYFQKEYNIEEHHILGAMQADLRFEDVTDESCRVIKMERFNTLYPR